MNENICKAGQCADLLLQDLVAANSHADAITRILLGDLIEQTIALLQDLVAANSHADAITRILLGDLIEQTIAIRTRLVQIDKALVAEGRDGD